MSEHVVVASKKPNGGIAYSVENADGPVAIPQRTHQGESVDFHSIPEDWPMKYEAPKGHALAWAFWLNDDNKLPRQVADAAVYFGGFGQ